MRRTEASGTSALGGRVGGWRSEAGQETYLRAYADALRLWPVHHESQLIETRFGATHALVSGPPSGTPLLLLPAAVGIGALQWFPNVEHLATKRRVVAVDFVGGPGRGHQSKPILDRVDCAQWVLDLLNAVSPDPVDVVGSSQGGWFALNAAIHDPERIARMALLAPAASFLPFRLAVRLMLRIGPYLPAATAGPSLRVSFGQRYKPDRRLVDLTSLGMKHFRYQQHAIIPDVFSDAELGLLRNQTLVIAGDRELIYSPRAMLDRAAATLGTVETELVPRAGHLLNIECSKHINSTLEDFLTDKIEPAKRSEAKNGPQPVGVQDNDQASGANEARSRQVIVERFPPARRVTAGALRAGRTRVPIHGLVELDVTKARQQLETADEDLSFTAFIIASVARAAATNPRLHAYRDWRGRVVSHDYVDLTTMVEVPTPRGPWPLALMMPDADSRSVADLTTDLRRVKANPSSERSGRWLERAPASLGRVPGMLRLAYWVGDRTKIGRRRTGTVAVSAVGMFGDGGGYAIAAPTLYTLNIVVGGTSVRPLMVDDQIVKRDMLDLTITVDHRLVDGAPAARFAAELRKLVENASVLDQS